MGLWLNTAFVRHGDMDSVEDALVRLFAAYGRARIRPAPRVPEPMDPMQYGGASVPRWGAAVFPGADGWTVVKTAPLTLLSSAADPAARPMLAELARALGVTAFQYDVHDGDTHRIVEASGDGRVERSGFLAHELDAGWEPSRDRVEVALRLVRPPPCGGRIRDSLPPVIRPMNDAMRELFDETMKRRADMLTWIARVDGEVVEDLYEVDVDAVLRCERSDFFSIEGAFAPAILQAFAGRHAEDADNATTVTHVIPHRPLPFDDGRLVIAERALLST